MNIVSRVRQFFAASQTKILYEENPTDRTLVNTGRAFTPADVAAYWQQAERGDTRKLIAFYTEMRARDPMWDAELRKGELRVANVKRDVLPWPPAARDEDAVPKGISVDLAKEVAAWVKLQVDAPEVKFDQALIAALGHCWNGLAALEIRYEPGGGSDGKDKLTGLPEIPGQRFCYLPNSSTLAYQFGPVSSDLIPVEKIKDQIVMLIDSPGVPNPARRGLSRRAVPAWVIRTQDLRWWASLIEINGRPYRVANVPVGAPRDEVIAAMKAMGGGGWAVVVEGVTVQMLEAKGDGTAHEKIRNAMAREMAVLVHGGTQTTDIAKDSGSTQSAEEMMDQAVEQASARAKLVAAEFREQLFRPLVFRNYGEDVARDYTPELVFEFEKKEDEEAFSRTTKNLYDSEVPLPLSWIYKRLGVTVREGEEVIKKSAPVAPLLPPPTEEQMIQMALRGHLSEMDKVTDEAALIAKRFGAGLDIVEPSRKLIEEAFRENLPLSQLAQRLRHKAANPPDVEHTATVLAAATLMAMRQGCRRGSRS